MGRKMMTAVAAGVLAVATVGCSDNGPDSRADFDVRFAADMSTNAQLVDLLGEAAGSLGPLSVAAIDSINITLTGIEAVRSEGTEGFVQLTLAPQAVGRVNLMKLPVDGGGDNAGVQLAVGSVPAGTYSGIRLRYDVATATVTLNQEVTVGQRTFAAGTYPLEVPSGAQTGIKVPFTNIVLAGGDAANAVLTFEAGSTIRNVVATGSGRMLLTPVLRVRVDVDD